MVEELRSRFAVDEILAAVDTRNLRSQRLLERLGFDRIGAAPAEIRGEATSDFRYRLGRGSGA